MFLLISRLQRQQIQPCPGVGPGLVSIPALSSRIWTSPAGIVWSLIRKTILDDSLSHLVVEFVEETLHLS